jgi:beta-lactamase superfamily II metal-dependent hydrolase
MPSSTSNTTRRADVRSKRLEVHILNGGYGESIIVRLPNGRWGVVDCYAPTPSDPRTNPTVVFLKEHRVRHLEFVCLTHPHDDHFRGMSQLFRSFQVKRFWRSPALTPEHLRNFLSRGRVEAEERGDTRSEEALNDLQRTLQLVGNLRRSQQLIVESPGINTVLYPWPVGGSSPGLDDLEIKTIAPPGNAVEGFIENLGRCFTADGKLTTDGPSLHCNDVSLALLIRYGETRVILGGDVEGPSWQCILRAVDKSTLTVRGVKVSHHGSPTGYCTGLWRVFSAAGKPVAVITPSLRHRLPTRGAVAHIRRHAEAVFVTCPDGVTFAGARYEFPDRYPVEERAALRGEMALFRRACRRTGVCSLSFGSLAELPSVTLRNGASEMIV